MSRDRSRESARERAQRLWRGRSGERPPGSIRRLVAEYEVEPGRPEEQPSGLEVLLVEFFQQRGRQPRLYESLLKTGCMEVPRDDASVDVTAVYGPGELHRALRMYVVESLACDDIVVTGPHDQLLHDVDHFVRWLQAHGYLEEKGATDLAGLVRELQGRRARAERATRLLRRPLIRYSRLSQWYDQFIDRRDFWLMRIEEGRVWLKDVHGAETFGPLWVAPKALRFLEERWLIAGGLIREEGRGKLVEVRGVYPMWTRRAPQGR